MLSPSEWQRFTLAYSASISGDRFTDLLIPVSSIAATGGIRLAGAYIAANSVPRFLIGPLLVGVVQRNPGRSWCAYGNWIQALGVGFLAIAIYTGHVDFVTFVVAGLISGLGTGIFGLAFQATVRNLVPDDNLATANSTLEVIDSLFTLLIPICAGIIVEWTGTVVALCVTTCGFIGAALLRMGLGASATRNIVSSDPNESIVLYLRGLGRTVASPFVGNRRRFISVGSLFLGATSVLIIPVASLQINSLGGNAISVGIAISAAGGSGLLAGFLAGRFTTITRSVRWTLRLLILAMIFIPIILVSPSIAIVIGLVAASDAVATWLYVSLPTLRMATETSEALIPITAGMMTCGAVAAFIVGASVSALGQGTPLTVFVSAVCLGGGVVIWWFGGAKVRRSLQGRIDN